jgi:hypothetical protein
MGDLLLLDGKWYITHSALFRNLGQPQELPPEGGEPPQDNGREGDFHGERRSNETHQSTTDPDARLYKKSKGS